MESAAIVQLNTLWLRDLILGIAPSRGTLTVVYTASLMLPCALMLHRNRAGALSMSGSSTTRNGSCAKNDRDEKLTLRDGGESLDL